MQTAHAVARAFASPPFILIEPSLCDWRQTSPEDAPLSWLKPEQVKGGRGKAQYNYLGYQVDVHYKPWMRLEELPVNESPVQFFCRIGRFYKHLLDVADDPSVSIPGEREQDAAGGGPRLDDGLCPG